MSMKNIQQGFLAIVVSAVMMSTLPVQSAQAATAVDFSSLVQSVSPAVVRVNVSKKLSQEELLQQQMPELLRRFFGSNVQIPNQPLPQEQSAYGSAFFISKDGYLLTNRHVIADASKVSITLNDRREIDAEVVGSDARTDVAVLKVKGNEFPALRIGDADKLKVGEPVLAIGSPFGFDYSASAGIVSAKSRTMSRETTVPFIQTDAALNPGNSGGPLFNQQGEVVGINSRIFSGTGGYMGLSFSIPIDVAMDVANQIRQSGKVTRSYLGVMLQDVDRNLAEAYNLSRPEGALVTQVAPNTPASKAGLKEGDIILSYNGAPLNRTSELLNLLNRARPNQTINLGVQRNDKPLNISATLSTAPDDATSSDSLKGGSGAKVSLGLALRDLTPAESQNATAKGVVVTDISPSGLAARAGIQPGDIITRINNTETPSTSILQTAIQALPAKRVARVAILRDGVPTIIGMRID